MDKKRLSKMYKIGYSENLELVIDSLEELGSTKKSIIESLEYIIEDIKNYKLDVVSIEDVDLYENLARESKFFTKEETIEKLCKELDIIIYLLKFKDSTLNASKGGRRFIEPTLEQLEIIKENHGAWLNGHISWNQYFAKVGVANNTLKRWLVDRSYKMK